MKVDDVRNGADPARDAGDDQFGVARPHAMPAGLSDDDRIKWLLATTDRKAQAAQRLDALRRYVAGGAVDADAFAESAGVSRPRFFAMLREYRRRDGGLDAVLPFSMRHKGSRGRTPAPAVLRAVRDVNGRKAMQGATKEAVARAVGERLGSGAPAISIIRRLVDAERGRAASSRVGGSDAFGRRLLIDSAALTVPMRCGERSVDWGVAGFVIDVATGYVLGTSAGQHWTPTHLAATAVDDALEHLPDLRVPAAPETVERPEITLVLGEGDPVGLMREVGRLSRLAHPPEAVFEGDRRHGGELVRVLGDRIGELEFRPRMASSSYRVNRTRGGDPREVGIEPLTQGELLEVVRHFVRLHNAALMRDGIRAVVSPDDLAAALRDLGLSDRG